MSIRLGRFSTLYKENDYVTHIERKYADLDGNNKTTDKKKLCNGTN